MCLRLGVGLSALKHDMEAVMLKKLVRLLRALVQTAVVLSVISVVSGAVILGCWGMEWIGGKVGGLAVAYLPEWFGLMMFLASVGGGILLIILHFYAISGEDERQEKQREELECRIRESMPCRIHRTAGFALEPDAEKQECVDCCSELDVPPCQRDSSSPE